MNLRLVFFFLFILNSCLLHAQIEKPVSIKSVPHTEVQQIVAAMTLEEKASLVIGTGLRFAGAGTVIGEADGRVPGAAGNTMDIARLKIPGTVLADGPAGVRIDPFHAKDSSKSYFATAFPVGTLLASSWDLDLVKTVGETFGNEIKEYGVDIILAPGMNIQRDPLNGRNFEYFSEDPLLSGKMGAALVKGIQSNGVGTSIKHFAANNQETSRNSVNIIVSERALREIYLRGFEIAIKESQPWTVMSSYNKINDVFTSESYDLLTTILRNEWGFKGYVMTDWYGGKDRVAQMKAGNDLIEPGNKKNISDIIEAVKSGALDIKILDKNVERILSAILNTPSATRYRYSDQPDLKSHAEVSRNAAAQSMVLLKNVGNTLPLKKNIKIALFGNASYETIIGGTGSGQVNVPYSISLDEGLRNKAFNLSTDLNGFYRTHLKQDKLDHPTKTVLTLGTPRMAPEYEPTQEVIDHSAISMDMAIYTIGRKSGEGADRKIEGDFNLLESEKKLIKKIGSAFKAQGKKLVVIMNIGAPIETVSWRDDADAILLAWQPGLEAGNAIADVVSGAINPSGKLAITFPIKYEDEPTSNNFPGTPVEKPKEVIYHEGIYVGYRYFSSFNIKTAFPFGFGGSYTSFQYSNLKLSSSTFNKELTFTVTVTNTGSVAGKEIVQCYISAPQNELDKPEIELKAFAKTSLLQPGAAQTLNFTIKPKDLASFYTTTSTWTADAGKYTIYVGTSCEDIRLSQPFSLKKVITVEKVSKALSPQVEIKELKRK